MQKFLFIQDRAWDGAIFVEFAKDGVSNPGENVPPDDLYQGIDLLLGVIPAKGDPEGAVDGLPGDAHGGEHMAPVALGAGGTGGDADAGILQNIDGVLGGNPRNGDVQNVGGLMGSGEDQTGKDGKLFTEAVQKLFFPGGVLPKGLYACLRRGGEGEDGGGGLCAAAVASLLAAALDKGREGLEPGRDIQSACFNCSTVIFPRLSGWR